jgi:hypothetical protein
VKRPSRRQRRLVILGLALLAFGLAYYSGSRYQNRPQPAPVIAGVAIHPPSPLPSLPNTESPSLIRQESLLGRWSLLMLDPHRGQSRSPALLRLMQIHNRLAAEPRLQQGIVFLYLPAEPHEPEHRAIDGLGENFTALSGEPEQVEETFRLFGVEPDGKIASLYLIGPKARLHALFTPDQDTATIAEDLITLTTGEP